MKTLILGICSLFLLLDSSPSSAQVKSVSSLNAVPYRFIGKVVYTKDGKDYACTGALVGEDLVLTNAHCVYNTSTGYVFSPIKFVSFAHKNGMTLETKVSDVVSAGATKDILVEQDWAILRIRSKLGSYFGYFGVDVSGNNGQSVEMSGIIGDGTSTIKTMNCSLVDKNPTGTVFNHNCVTGPGEGAGAPLFSVNNDLVMLYALNSNYGKQQAVPASAFIDQIINLKKAFDGTKTGNTIQFCNQASENFSLALAYGTRSLGWYTVEKGTCKEVLYGTGFEGTLYVYSRKFGDGEKAFCIDPKYKFEFNDADSRRSCSGTMQNFSFTESVKASNLKVVNLN